MSHNDDLIEELAQWRRRLPRSEARGRRRWRAVPGEAARVNEISGSIEEVMEEIETGRSARPIMDHINGNGTADHPINRHLERVERMTAIEPDSVKPVADLLADAMAPLVAEGLVMVDPVIETKPDGGAVEWTSADLDHELLHALTHRPDHKLAWEVLIREGATNDRIWAALKDLWDFSSSWCPPAISGGKTGHTAFGGAAPSFTMGESKGAGRATLYGAGLVARIRSVLGIPMPSEAAKKPVKSRKPKPEPAGV